jgi:catechol-2,3-dioxygenase
MNQDIHFTDLGPAMQTAMTETWGLLTEEQKKKVTHMRMDTAIKGIELKISDMEQRVLIAKDFIKHIKVIKEMIKQGK